MNIAVIGTGYVGIVTAVVFADFGNQVRGLDIDPDRIKVLKKGLPPIYEPKLKEFLQRGLTSKRLTFTTNYSEALKNVEAVFICVGTPQQENGAVDLQYVESAVQSIAKNLSQPAIIVLKSTVPPGVHHHLKKIISKHIKVAYEFASVPEFLREGSAIDDTLNPSRVVIGVQSQKAEKMLLKLHQPLPGERLLTDVVSAQMVKYAANAFLATKISFANAIARVCDLINADVQAVSKGIGLDPRIGQAFLNPGLGYGGSCFPKDVQGLYHLSKEKGYHFSLLSEVSRINDTQVDYVLERVRQKLSTFSGQSLAVLGLAFKPETDDLRDARSLVLIRQLLNLGARVVAYDPVAIPNARKILGETIHYARSAYEAITAAQAVFIVTEWNEFKELDLARVKKLMKGKLIVDGRNLYNPQTVKALGLQYLGIGRK